MESVIKYQTSLIYKQLCIFNKKNYVMKPAGAKNLPKNIIEKNIRHALKLYLICAS